MSETITYNTEYFSKITSYVNSKIQYKPKILIIGGSGLDMLADAIEDPIEIKYDEIPNFPQSPASKQVKCFVFGSISNTKVVCMKGRFHFYEGLSLREIIIPVRMAKLLGVELLIVTNAAGSCNSTYKVGDIMVIKDHINFLGFGGQNPLIGPNDDQFGPRFFPVNTVYDRELINIAMRVAKETNLENNMHLGVYAMVGGPNYESVAEIKALRALGVDAIGMSTVPEVLGAAHAGLKVFGFSVITNVGIADYDVDTVPNHEEVLKAVNEKAGKLKEFITKFIDKCSFPCKCN